jgi:transporter family-2 protein
LNKGIAQGLQEDSIVGLLLILSVLSSLLFVFLMKTEPGLENKTPRGDCVDILVSYVVLVGFIGGIAVAVQASLAGVITEKLGVIENAFVVFGGGFIVSLVVVLLNQGGKLKAWQSLPWYAFLAGPLGIVIITSIGYATPRIGLAGTLTLIVVSQLVIGVIFDHFGWLGQVRPMDLTRLIGILFLFFGTWIVLR